MSKRIEVVTGCLTKNKCGWGYVESKSIFLCTHPKNKAKPKKVKIKEVQKMKFLPGCPLIEVDPDSGLYIPGENQNIILNK
jgi:hypothetical protein